MKGLTNPSIVGNSLQKTLRNRMTDAEQRLWHRLRGRQLAGCKFRRQHPFLDYVLDFVCLEKSLVVEVDGGQHLESESDRLRDQRLAEAGLRVLRFWNHEVLQETDAVLDVILEALNAVHNHSSPFKGEVRRGMGADFGATRGSSSDQPHSPPSRPIANVAVATFPLEGGGVDASKVRA
ncbi:endonuclease domain-containing protein [Propionivibrio limicola]|uniref:endonuclease domain-containing protein n=1 Tax=Propionivibrio limicola TaxID=167645 RepID=UPI001291CA7B|nr:endonuclease domain-containing protein [Propionivibrio limicola]